MKYFIHIDGQQQGPFEENELLLHNVSPSTMVWCEGMPNWAPASQVQGLNHLFQGESQPQPQPQQSAPPGFQPTPQPQYQSQQQPQYGYQPQQRPVMPETYLVWAILVTLFCCLPLGIVSIVKASQVSSAYNVGDYALAERNSQDAKKWAKWGAIAGVIGLILYIVFIVLAATLGVMSN